MDAKNLFPQPEENTEEIVPAVESWKGQSKIGITRKSHEESKRRKVLKRKVLSKKSFLKRAAQRRAKKNLRKGF